MDTKNKDLRPITLYLPENLDLNVLPARLRKHHDRIRYFLGKIYWQRIIYHRPRDYFVPMKAECFRRYLPWRYKPLIDALIEAKILECDDVWSVGSKSKGYRLGPEFRCAMHRKHLLTDPELCANVRRLEDEVRCEPTGPVHTHLRKMLERMDIDMETARRTVTTLPEESRCCLVTAEAIADRQWWFHVCQYGRLHTNITNLHRDLRPALRLDGRMLVNIDIRNSQPLFLAPILLEYYTSGTYKPSLLKGSSVESQVHEEEFRETKETENNQQQQTNNKTQQSSHYDVQSTLCDEVIGSAYRLAREKMPKDVRQYIRFVERGRLYEYLMDADAVPQEERSDYKKKIFKGVFFNENQHTDSRQYRTFARKFPNVLRLIRRIKAKGYKRMAHLLQRTESGFMIGVVCRWLMERHPDLWIATIHDSVLTVAGSEDLVVRVIKEEFGRHFGLRPSLRIERYEAASPG